MTDLEMQGIVTELEVQRNWSMTRGAQLASALATAQSRIVELERIVAELTPTPAVPG